MWALRHQITAFPHTIHVHFHQPLNQLGSFRIEQSEHMLFIPG